MSDNKIWKIYKHTAPNGKAYIGKTSMSLEKRFQKGRAYKQCIYFEPAIKEFGWDNFKHEVLLTVGTKEMAKKAEEAMIIGYNTLWPNGYNCMKGHKQSKESNKKNSESHKGKYTWNKGIKCPQISQGEKGHIVTSETRRKIGDANKGKPAWNKGIKRGFWFTNGKINVLQFECPEGFYPGRVNHK